MKSSWLMMNSPIDCWLDPSLFQFPHLLIQDRPLPISEDQQKKFLRVSDIFPITERYYSTKVTDIFKHTWVYSRIPIQGLTQDISLSENRVPPNVIKCRDESHVFHFFPY